MQTQFSGLKIGLMVKNNKTEKNWMITEFLTTFSSLKEREPDEYKVRISNGMGKSQIITLNNLKKNYNW